MDQIHWIYPTLTLICELMTNNESHGNMFSPRIEKQHEVESCEFAVRSLHLWPLCGQKAAAVLRAACCPSTSVVLQRLVPLCTGPPLHCALVPLCTGRPCLPPVQWPTQLHCEARPGQERVVKSHRADPAPAEREPTQPGEV